MPEREKPRLHVEFFTEAVENKRKSKEAGRPIFEDKEFVRIRIPGDRNRTQVAPADEKALRDRSTNEWLSYIDRFPEHYAAFKRGQTYIGEGTPLSELSFLTESKRAELRGLNIYTAEHLAAMDGTPLKQLGMGGRELKDQAQAWLDKAAGMADATRQAAENAALRAEMEELRRQMADLNKPQSAAPASMSRFASMAPEDIKAWIAEQTGARPKGNPSLATLIATADEIDLQLAKNKAA